VIPQPRPFTGDDLLAEALSGDLSQTAIRFVCDALVRWYDEGGDMDLLLDLRCGARSATSRARNASTSHRYAVRDGLLRAAWATIPGSPYQRAQELHRVATDALERPEFLPVNETETLIALALPTLIELGLPGQRQLLDILQR
jgi:hypothetical protein